MEERHVELKKNKKMKINKDSLGDRIKRYEEVANYTLMKRTPVICRIDGRSFHTFTRGFKRPFDDILIKSMQETTKYLCEHIQGCVFGYTQSDEITLILCDYQTYETAAFFDYRVQKLASIIASMATLSFNVNFKNNIDVYLSSLHDIKSEEDVQTHINQYNAYAKAYQKMAIFDCRCFNVPVPDVTNSVLWRQKDAERNSINMVAQSEFSHKQLQGKSCNQMQDMLHEEKGINWNDFPTMCKRGTAVVKNSEGKWIIDTEMPILTQDRNYIESRILFDDDLKEKNND